MAQHQINEEVSEAAWLQEVKSRYQYSTWSGIKTDDAFGIVSIYKVPKFLKNQNQQAYVPQVVSLGLFHHKPTNPLADMDRRKVDAVIRMRQKLPNGNKNLLDHIVKDSLSEIRKCYEDEVEANDEAVAWACLQDGCFILEILDLLTRSDEDHHSRQHNITVEEDNSDPIYNKNKIRSRQFDILGDFFMMENRIPIVVLVKILDLQMENLQHTKEWLYRRLRQVSRVVHPFLTNAPLQQKEEKSQNEIKDAELEKQRHMLEFFYSFVTEKPSIQKKDKQNKKRKKKYCLNKVINASASELVIVGLKFRAYYGIPCQKKLCFDERKRTMFLPALFIKYKSEMILRNLMAMEFCRPEKQKQLSSYVLLMNTLVKEVNDVAVLRRAGVIKSSMGSDRDVMNLLNGLCKVLNLLDDSEDPFVAMKAQVNKWYYNRLKEGANVWALVLKTFFLSILRGLFSGFQDSSN